MFGGWRDGKMVRLKDDRCANRGVVIVTHAVSSRGPERDMSSVDSWSHSERRSGACREGKRWRVEERRRERD